MVTARRALAVITVLVGHVNAEGASMLFGTLVLACYEMKMKPATGLERVILETGIPVWGPALHKAINYSTMK